ncbi:MULTISPECIES: ParB/RepB/Spo0J family partition protein [Erysipelothrix]|uniref:ParB/RepB/Spo0J family partition protein n=1 Tax=Erysipelothrix TaxID=1647 RepID=UPI00140C8651|nr:MULTISPECIES: ParB N-terminal domain-containing protein [Erysipelothrix]MDV7678442.1 ParB N-terminal domain-containing protein [Erysipelothrix rhusiopathiae]WMT70142.1 ParB N-terminal domain-containing protein [Erysipelothrix rhusiopathiae]
MSGFNLSSMFSEETIASKTKNIQVQEIDLDHIQNNHGNFYPINNEEDNIELEALIHSIDNDGLLTPVLLYPNDNGSYRIVSGHRRCEAYRRLGFSNISAIITKTEYEDGDEEQIKIISANLQREKTPSIIRAEVSKLSDIFDRYKEKNKIKVGMLKRDWIGLQIGRTGRTVQKYLYPENLNDGEEQLELFVENRRKEKKKKTPQELTLDRMRRAQDIIAELQEDLYDLSFTEQQYNEIHTILNDFSRDSDNLLKKHF